MSQLFDLNVNSYSLRELLDFFELTSNDDGALVERKCIGLKQKIKGDSKLGPVSKQKIHDFLNKAMDRLSQSRANIQTVKASSASGAASAASAAQAQAPNDPPTKFMQLKNEVGDGMLITRPSEKFALENANNGVQGKIMLTGAPPGVVNPIAISTIKRAMNVDTRFRNNYYSTKSTDFVFTIPYKIENVTSISVATYEIPLTYYAVSQQAENNCIVFQWGSTPTTPTVYDNTYTLIIPDGNYVDATFQTGVIVPPIQATINSILVGTDLVKFTGMEYSVDSISGRSIFACNSATDASGNKLPLGSKYTGPMRIMFNVTGTIYRNAASATNNSFSQNDTTPLPYFMGWQLGFRSAIYEMHNGMDASGNLDVPQAAVSEGVCLIVGPKYVFLCIDDYNNNVNNYYASAFGSSTIAPNIIARLNTQEQLNATGPYSIMTGESLSTSLTFSREYFGPVDIHRIHIRLLDEYGRVLDLNNMDWSFALMFECVYSSSSA
jgi:hypothetical protein